MTFLVVRSSFLVGGRKKEEGLSRSLLENLPFL
jgi:hypothetical protein